MEPDRDKLSNREIEILQLASEGLTDKEIAGKLGVRLSTVRTYWDRIRIKLLATNRTEAVARALKPEFGEIQTYDLVGLADALPHLLAVIGSDGGLQYANSKMQEYAGFHSPDGFDWASFVHPDDHLLLARHTQRRTLERADSRLKLRCKRSDGAYRLHLTTMTPFEAHGGKLFRWIWSAVDIHELGYGHPERD